MATKYALSNIVRSPRGGIKATLTENGSIIAYVRKPTPDHWVYPFEVTKWCTDRARTRFDTYCECLSMAEVLEILTR